MTTAYLLYGRTDNIETWLVGLKRTDSKTCSFVKIVKKERQRKTFHMTATKSNHDGTKSADDRRIERYEEKFLDLFILLRIGFSVKLIWLNYVLTLSQPTTSFVIIRKVACFGINIMHSTKLFNRMYRQKVLHIFQ